MKQRREIELKFRLSEGLGHEGLSRRLSEHGFDRSEPQLEFDFVPDTVGYRCRANRILVRLRRVTTGSDRRVLLTFKVRRSSRQFLDAWETEFWLAQPDLEAWQHINRTLRPAVGLALPEAMLGATDLVQAVKLAARGGLDHFRMMIEKRRTMFSRAEVVATIDELPGEIGSFLELEAHDGAALEALVAELGLPEAHQQRLDYGDIIMAYHGSESARGRTAVFDERTRQEIYDIVTTLDTP